MSVERRPWERQWECLPNDFLRNTDVKHPSRAFIADQTAEIGGSVLECGCASAIDYPLHRSRGLKYSGRDITPKFVRKANELYPEADIKIANVLDLPLNDESFDTVYCKALLEHMHPKEWPSAVVEMWRVAKKQMIIALYSRPSPQNYDGPLVHPPQTKGGRAYSRSINQQHLETLLKNLLGASVYRLKLVGKHPIYWIYIVPKNYFLAKKKEGLSGQINTVKSDTNVTV